MGKTAIQPTAPTSPAGNMGNFRNPAKCLHPESTPAAAPGNLPGNREIRRELRRGRGISRGFPRNWMRIQKFPMKGRLCAPRIPGIPPGGFQEMRHTGNFPISLESAREKRKPWNSPGNFPGNWTRSRGTPHEITGKFSGKLGRIGQIPLHSPILAICFALKFYIFVYYTT